MECYLGLTETFIHEYLAAFGRIRPVVIAKRFENLDLFAAPAGVRLYRCPPRRGTPAWAVAALRRRLGAGRAPLEKILAREGVRLIHAHYGPTACGLLDVRRRTRLPLVTSFYGYDASMTPVIEEFGSLYRRLFDIGDAFLVEGTSMRSKLEALGCPSSKLRLQRIAIDPMRYRFREREDPGSGPLTLLLCGRLVPKKGCDIALRALAEARRGDRRLRLRILGDGPERSAIEALIRELELDDAVTLLGRRPRGTFIEELDRAHIYIQPSRTAADGDSEGGAPTTLLEAQACGLPIIATRHADIPQIVRENDSALLCEEADVGALAACISVLSSSPRRWPSMGRAGRVHVEARHDVRRLATELEILYATLAETGRLDAVGREG
jgi:colanic acid/amylovoran biosynthesis glycosyltransferase